MKVTDELFIRLCNALNRLDLADSIWTRRDVEAALADVPDGWEVGLSDRLEDRVKELEAKLGKIAQCLSVFDEPHDAVDLRSSIRRIVEERCPSADPEGDKP